MEKTNWELLKILKNQHATSAWIEATFSPVTDTFHVRVQLTSDS
jgi:hypothetical protein